MSWVRRRQQHLDHRDQDNRRDAERGPTSVRPEVPGTQQPAASSLSPTARTTTSQWTMPSSRQRTPVCRHDSQHISSTHPPCSGPTPTTTTNPLQPLPCSSGESAPSEPGSPRNEGSLSRPPITSSGARSTTAELPNTSKIPEAPPDSRCSRCSCPLFLLWAIAGNNAEQQLKMSWERKRQQHLDHRDQDNRRDAERGPTSVRPEVPGTQQPAASSLSPTARTTTSQWSMPSSRQRTPVCRHDSQHISSTHPPCSGPTPTTTTNPLQPLPCSSGESAPSEPGSPRNEGSLSRPPITSSGARSTTAELPNTSKIPEAPPDSRCSRCSCPLFLHTDQYREEEESSSASTGPSHHPVPPVGGDELNLSPLLVQSRPIIIRILSMDSVVIGPQSAYRPWSSFDLNRLDRLNTFRHHREPVQRCRADHILKESNEEIISIIMKRLFDEVSDDEDSDDEDVCRICHSSDSSPANPLASPCLCKGSLNFIHVDCLKTWIVSRIERGAGPTMVNFCEVCNGWLTLDPKALNIKEFYKETLQKMIANPEQYQMALWILRLYGPSSVTTPPPVSKFRRFIRRIRRWMTFRPRSS